MNFKDLDRLQKEFWEIEPQLRLILCDAEAFLHRFGHTLTLTCLMRTPEEQQALFDAKEAVATTSVHMYGRGGDARAIDDPVVSQALLDYINLKYVYDPSRPNLKTLIEHEGTALHYHFQIMEGT